MQQGFSLLGVVVSLSILTTGVLATAQLMARTENTVGLSRERLVAINLAREGLELVQARRDTNWGELVNPNPDPIQNVTSWVSSICPEEVGARGPDYTFTIESIEVSPPPDQDHTLAITPGGDQTLSVAADGMFNHRGVGEETIYSREIIADCSLANDDQGDGVESVDVSARVEWTRRGIPREVVINTRLFDWERH